jgi:putative lipoic acid-binding regulatory protein
MADTDSLFEFPCAFPIKAMGVAHAEFADLVLNIVGAHVSPADITGVEHRNSRAGKYLSVTVTIRATSRAQLDAIYRDLSGHESILMAL